jgi:hypothetical protein
MEHANTQSVAWFEGWEGEENDAGARKEAVIGADDTTLNNFLAFS